MQRGMNSLRLDLLGDRLETLMADRRFRIAGAIVGAVILLVSMGLVVASKGQTRHLSSMASHLPAQPLNIPILRHLPEPQPMKGRAGPVAAPARQPGKAIVTARR